MLRPRGVIFRALALATVLAFVNLTTFTVVGSDVRLSVGTAPAKAQGKDRRVALFVLPDRDAHATDAQVLQTLLRQQVSSLEGVRLVTGSPDPAVRLAAEVAPQVEDGVRALNVRDHVKAEELLSAAYEGLVRFTGEMDLRLLARTTKGLGVARVMAGQTRAGQDMMRASLNVWPDQLPPEYGYTLDVMNAFKDAQAEQMEQPNGSLQIVTEPAGASVFVDGKVPGYSPLTVSDLAIGLHWVQVALDGYERAGAFVEVRGGEEGAHRFSLAARANKQAYDKVFRGLSKAVRNQKKAAELLPALAGLLGADETLVLEVGTEGSAYSLRGFHGVGAEALPVEVDIKRDANFITSLELLASQTLGVSPRQVEEGLRLDAPPRMSVVAGADGQEELYIDPNDPILKGTESDEDRPITSEWWFWVIIGGVAAGLTVGGVLLFSQSGEKKGPVGDVVIDLHALP